MLLYPLRPPELYPFVYRLSIFSLFCSSFQPDSFLSPFCHYSFVSSKLLTHSVRLNFIHLFILISYFHFLLLLATLLVQFTTHKVYPQLFPFPIFPFQSVIVICYIQIQHRSWQNFHSHLHQFSTHRYLNLQLIITTSFTPQNTPLPIHLPTLCNYYIKWLLPKRA